MGRWPAQNVVNSLMYTQFFFNYSHLFYKIVTNTKRETVEPFLVARGHRLSFKAPSLVSTFVFISM